MAFGFRFLGIIIIACGFAVCYGAAVLWPAEMFEIPLRSSVSAGGLLRLAGAGIAALFGAGNVVAGLAVVMLRTARE